MLRNSQQSKQLIKKLEALPPEQRREVEDFIDFLCQRQERGLTRAAMSLSHSVFEKIWDNPADNAYDR